MTRIILPGTMIERILQDLGGNPSYQSERASVFFSSGNMTNTLGFVKGQAAIVSYFNGQLVGGDLFTWLPLEAVPIMSENQGEDNEVIISIEHTQDRNNTVNTIVNMFATGYSVSTRYVRLSNPIPKLLQDNRLFTYAVGAHNLEETVSINHLQAMASSLRNMPDDIHVVVTNTGVFCGSYSDTQVGYRSFGNLNSFVEGREAPVEFSVSKQGITDAIKFLPSGIDAAYLSVMNGKISFTTFDGEERIRNIVVMPSAKNLPLKVGHLIPVNPERQEVEVMFTLPDDTVELVKDIIGWTGVSQDDLVIVKVPSSNDDTQGVSLIINKSAHITASEVACHRGSLDGGYLLQVPVRAFALLEGTGAITIGYRNGYTFAQTGSAAIAYKGGSYDG